MVSHVDSLLAGKPVVTKHRSKAAKVSRAMATDENAAVNLA